MPQPEDYVPRTISDVGRDIHLDYVREAARNNIYLKKPCSKFIDKCGNLPLDLWDSTPDP